MERGFFVTTFIYMASVGQFAYRVEAFVYTLLQVEDHVIESVSQNPPSEN
jgi:hypothetical protein